MGELSLTFYDNGFADDFRFRIDWPVGSSRLRAYLGTDIRNVASVNANFIISNTPPGHRIYFLAGSAYPFEHKNMKEDLRSFGEPFEQKIETIAEITAGFFRRRNVEKKAYLTFGSTDKKGVVSSVFESYKLGWFGEGWSFIFLVAKQEPTDWKNIFHILRTGEAIPRELVLQCHCILKTEYEHGIALASTEITRESIVHVTENIARELSLHMSVKGHTLSTVPSRTMENRAQ